jgi:pimeloyl-ACP methyl ester carboxylesterase
MIRGRLGATSVLTLSRRGMGLSAAPVSGYAPTNFADDLEAIVKEARPEPFVLFGHSMGVPIALEYALRNPSGLTALVLGDALAEYIDFAAAGTFDVFLADGALEFESWDDAFQRIGRGDQWRFDRTAHRLLRQDDEGRIHALIDQHALRRTVDESRRAHKAYWARLNEIRVPVMLLLAAPDQTRVTADHLDLYREGLSTLDVRRLPTGHDLGLGSDVGPLCDALNFALGT